MNKYPGIYRAEGGGEYIYANKDSYYCFSRELWDESDSEDNHENDKNITAEYLTNTYGKVESKEHAEFIVKLAKSAGFKLRNHLFHDWFCFTKKYLHFYPTEARASDAKEKLITLPLPPKEEVRHDPQTVGAAAIATLSIMGYEYHGGELWKPPLGNTPKDGEEWPQVGDEALTSSKQKVSVLAIHGGEVWVKYDGTPIGTGYASIRSATLSKPPAPEEELESEIIKIIKKKHAELIVGPITSEMIGAMACNAAEILIKHYDIKKKPE